MGLRAIIMAFLNRPKKPKPPKLYTFTFGYMVYDFDLEPHYFTLKAANQDEANELAIKEHDKMLAERRTVSMQLWPVAAR